LINYYLFKNEYFYRNFKYHDYDRKKNGQHPPIYFIIKSDTPIFDIENIVFVFAFGHFVKIYFTNRKMELKSVHLGYMRDRLDHDCFYLSERSHLVSLDHAESYYFMGRNIKIRCRCHDGIIEANVPKGIKVEEFKAIAESRGIRKLKPGEKKYILENQKCQFQEDYLFFDL
jgi:hypothetical protein